MSAERTLWDSLRRAHTEQGLSQRQVTAAVSTRAGVTEATVRDWLTRRVPPTEFDLFTLFRECRVPADMFEESYQAWVQARLGTSIPTASEIQALSDHDVEGLFSRIEYLRDFCKIAEAITLAERVYEATRHARPSLACRAGLYAVRSMAWHGRRREAIRMLPELLGLAKEDGPSRILEVGSEASHLWRGLNSTRALRILESCKGLLDRHPAASSEVERGLAMGGLGIYIDLLGVHPTQVDMGGALNWHQRCLPDCRSDIERVWALEMLTHAFLQMGDADASVAAHEAACAAAPAGSPYDTAQLGLTSGYIARLVGDPVPNDTLAGLAAAEQFGLVEVVYVLRIVIADIEAKP